MAIEPIHMMVSCPLPALDFDRITLGHGSGGTLTHKLLDEVIYPLLSNDILNEQHDGAMMRPLGKAAFTTDSYVISPIFFPGGNIGDLAIHGTVNDLAMCGAVPTYISLALILEEGLLIEDLWKVLVSIKHACESAGVNIVTGDTKVVEKGKGDQMFINTAGIGEIHPHAHIDARHINIGDQIIVSGKLAAHGIAVMSQREGLEFETTVKSDTAHVHEMVLAMIEELQASIHFMRDPTRGGVATVLVEIARQIQQGIKIYQKHLPIDPQVEGACEMLGLDPLYVANEGIFLTFVAKDKAEKALQLIRSFDKGQHAAIIGEVVQAHPRQVVLQSKIGGRRVVNMLTGEQLPRIC